MNQYLKNSWHHIRRAPYQALAAIGIMVLTFFVATVTVLVAAGSDKILKYFETRPQVTAFFKDEVKSEEIDSLRAKLNQTGKIKEIKFVSKEEALTIYKEQNKTDPLLLEMVTANILPASLEISTTNISFLTEIAQILKIEPKIEEVIFQEDVVKSLKNWTGTIRKIGIGLTGFLGLVSFLIILIIIGMKIALRKDEIEILRLVGANNWYIRAPFILEGIFYGGLGAFLAWGMSLILILYSTPLLVNFLAGIPLFPIPILFLLAILGAEVLLGIILGTLGSFWAVRRYLK